MSQFYKLKRDGNSYNVFSNIPFDNTNNVSKDNIEKSFKFAYNMSFGRLGAHRAYRTGGQVERPNGEIFVNTFQGKLSEFAFYEFALSRSVNIREPDTDTYSLGMWDSYDFMVNNKKIAIKSTKYYGNLLLLETQDWDSNGEYKPNIEMKTSHYDYFVLVRLKPSADTILKHERLLYETEVKEEKLKHLIINEQWEYDLVGYITHDDLVYIIEKNFVLPQNSLLNRRTRMDATNYYVQANNMRKIDDLFKEL